MLNLALIGRLELLREEFQQVMIPGAVAAELDLESDRPGNPLIRQAVAKGWIQIVALQLPLPPRQTLPAEALLDEVIHAGEGEAIALALDSGCHNVLLDDSAARMVAARLGLRVIGLAGVLISAKKAGRIAAVGPVLRELQVKARFFLHERFVSAVLSEAGECT